MDTWSRPPQQRSLLQKIRGAKGEIPSSWRMNNEMAAIGARGVSIIFASGDSGYQKAQKYPSSSPYVTSVGGVFNGELGMDVLQVDDISTGGFSSLGVNLIGKWQVDAVNAWTKTKGARGYTNTSRRACPDLAIYDSGFYTIQDGSEQPIGGTSAAAPTLAADTIPLVSFSIQGLGEFSLETI